MFLTFVVDGGDGEVADACDLAALALDAGHGLVRRASIDEIGLERVAVHRTAAVEYESEETAGCLGGVGVGLTQQGLALDPARVARQVEFARLG